MNQKVSKLYFIQTSMHFHNELATLEPQDGRSGTV